MKPGDIVYIRAPYTDIDKNFAICLRKNLRGDMSRYMILTGRRPLAHKDVWLVDDWVTKVKGLTDLRSFLL